MRVLLGLCHPMPPEGTAQSDASALRAGPAMGGPASPGVSLLHALALGSECSVSMVGRAVMTQVHTHFLQSSHGPPGPVLRCRPELGKAQGKRAGPQ